MDEDKIAIVEIPRLKVGDKILGYDISFEWKRGEQWCVTGRSGSGKTVLLKLVAGLLGMGGSRISFPELEKIKAASENGFMVSDKIAFVPQEVKIPSGYINDQYYQRRYHATELDDIPTVRDIFNRVSDGGGLSVEVVSEQMSLTKLLDAPFIQLSNGQTRRFMIALALFKNPAILVLDNPYTGLDHEARRSLNNHIQSLIDGGMHILIGAHEHEIKDMLFVTNKLVLNSGAEIISETDLPDYYTSNVFGGDGLVVAMKDIHVRYFAKDVLSLPEWYVEKGQKWVVRGANGSGKSTLLSLIVADHPQAYSNNVSIFGNRRGVGVSIWDVKRRIGYFSSELHRYFSPNHLSRQVVASGWNDIVGQVDLSLSIDRKKILEEFADWLGIVPLLDIKFGHLSFSQQKMILLARAMIRNPELLILDEPLQGMDEQWREHFKKRIKDFSAFRTVLYVTHDDEEIPFETWNELNLDVVN